MKKITTVLALFLVFSLAAQDAKRVFGKVTDGTNPMKNVEVSILDKDKMVVTDNEGAYEIVVAEGDKLKFSYTGMKTITIKIEDVTRVLNLIMIPDVTELDEVIVKNSRRRSQTDLEFDYAVNKNIIKTAFGYLDAERSAGQVRILNEEDINTVSLCILDLLRGRLPGIRIIGDCQAGGEVYGRSGRSGPMIWDVDGQIFGGGGGFTPSAPVWINIGNIKRVAILNNLANVAQYGNLGASGVIVINTVNGSALNNQIVDRARLRNNFLKAKVLSKEEVAANTPIYMRQLLASSSFEEAKSVFEKYNKQYSSSPYFYLDTYKFFHNKWNDQTFADDIIANSFELFSNNAVLLKALAYSYEEQGRYDKANETYKEAFILRPNYAQSYLDMANSYRNLKETKQAAAMYARYEYLLQEGFMEVDTAGFGPIIYREFNNLLMLDKEAVVKGRKSKNLYVAEEEFKGTRLVFEWNDSEAEFDLQFVNPGNQYHTWKHSLADNSEVIEREKNFGYNLTEYLIDDSLPGTWKVNINYLGNKSLSPTYLKATVYYNYGSKAQRKEVKVFKLLLKDVNQELFKLNIGAAISAR